ncbi:TPA: hypothetical protein ACOFCN_000267 [Stenotrophomonas maltophilia]
MNGEPEPGGGRAKARTLRHGHPPPTHSEVFFSAGISGWAGFMAKKANSGRPAFKPTSVQRRLVRNAAAGGMTHEEIAVALQIHRHTLAKYFEAELSSGALHRRMEVLDAMARTALKGNVAAQKAFLAQVPMLAAPPVPQEKPVGKKEKANADAVGAEVGTGWEGLLGENVTPIHRAAGK